MGPHKPSPHIILAHSLSFSCKPLNWGNRGRDEIIAGRSFCGSVVLASGSHNLSHENRPSSLPDSANAYRDVQRQRRASGAVRAASLLPGWKEINWIASQTDPSLQFAPGAFVGRQLGSNEELSPHSTNGKQTILTPG
ncbi:hypothetical protein L209DRAFT_31371 [Thermothelomyces heterothallicus CBS 203.75]